MKKGVLFLVFALIFTMLAPAQAAQLPQNQMQEVSAPNNINGKYVISVKKGDDWNEIGALNFGKFLSTETINLGNFNGESIKLSRDGGGAAYLDAVLLNGPPAVKANNDDEKLLNKLSKKDLDIIPVGEEGVIVEFSKCVNNVLTVVGRIENVNISNEPLQFPVENNYKFKDDVEDFYTYILGSNIGTVKVDGILDEVTNKDPFVKENRTPDSGHPSGDIYFWVMNDDENLYVSMDTTPDNTFDGDKDYAKVYVNTDKGIKEFKVSVPETNWGKSGFTYTDKVSYEHKVYEFAIPLSEIDASAGEELSVAFVAYGTMSYNNNCNNPKLAYDSQSGVYLSVFEHSYHYNTIIVGEFVDKYGDPMYYRFSIANVEMKDDEEAGTILSDPCVTFNSSTKEFLVTWIEHHSNSYYVCGRLISFDDSKFNVNYKFYEIGEPFIISSDDQSYHRIDSAKVSYDSDKNVFLTTWQEANNTDMDSIFGQFLDEDGTKEGSKFNISTTSAVDKKNPSLAYSESQEAFLVAWEDGDDIAACGVKLLDNQHVSNTSIIGKGENPDVSYTNSSQRLFVTWENDGYLYGQCYDLKNTAGTNYLDPIVISDAYTISSPHDSNYVAYPSAYYSSYHNILCVWNLYKPEQESFAELRYVDIYAEPEGPPFFTDEELDDRDEIDVNKLPIAISGDNEMQNIIAYVLEDSNNIGYRIIGDVPEEPSLKTCINPDIAYDGNKYYLSVFEYRLTDYDYYPLSSHIYGEIIDRDGDVVSDKFPISEGSEFNFNYSPTVAYDKENGSFLVAWASQYGEGNNILMSSEVTLVENSERPDVGDIFPISGNDFGDFDFHEYDPELSYGSGGQFLLAWRQYTNDSYGDIYGRIVDSNNIFDNDNFLISSDEYQINPSVCYNPTDDAYLVAWNYFDDNSEIIKAQVVNSSGELIEGGDINIGGEWCNFPNVSLNPTNEQFFITWHDYSDGSVIKGQYVSLNSELIPKKENNEILITPDNIYDGIYPSSYGNGYNDMLCAWSSTLIESGDYYPRLQYIDNVGGYKGEAFYPDEYNEDYARDNLTASTQIAMSGDNEGKVIIAYDYEPEEVYFRMSSNPNDYELYINYRIFGEVNIQPYIEFSNAPFDEITVGDTIQTKVKLYNNEFPNGKEIDEDLFYFSEEPEIASIDRNTGLINGISEGETNVHAVYDPWAESDSDDVKFSDGLIILKNPEKVKVIPKPLPTLEFDKETYSVQINKTIPFIVTLSNYNGIKNQNVTHVVAYDLGNPEIASICTGGAITGLAVGTTTVSAIYTDGGIEITALATITVNPSPQLPSGSSAPTRTPIGQILVNNKVIETLYEENVDAKNNSYTFIADKSGETARLWLDSEFYDNLAEDYPNRIIQFKWDSGTYTLPLNCNEVLNEINNKAKKVHILIEKVDDKTVIEAANKSAESMGADVISELIDFSVFIEKNSENTVIESYDFYAERTINKLNLVDEYISTAMKFVEDKTTLTFAPSVFNDDYATIKYRGNGIFTIIQNPQSFNDITNHWAKLNIEKLATRNIAFGKENNNFVPNDFITRAEFAVMITRALGITEEEGTNYFTDISNEWYAEDISTAFIKGLINGRNDGKFYPNEKIQRKDMAVIIQNALKFTDMTFEISNADSILLMFKDESLISNYAREATAICADAGIIMGRETKNFDPDANATRAEATAIIERMLKFIEFMN